MKRLLFPPGKPWEGAPESGLWLAITVILFVVIYVNTYAGFYF